MCGVWLGAEWWVFVGFDVGLFGVGYLMFCVVVEFGFVDFLDVVVLFVGNVDWCGVGRFGAELRGGVGCGGGVAPQCVGVVMVIFRAWLDGVGAVVVHGGGVDCVLVHLVDFVVVVWFVGARIRVVCVVLLALA